MHNKVNSRRLATVVLASSLSHSFNLSGCGNNNGINPQAGDLQRFSLKRRI